LFLKPDQVNAFFRLMDARYNRVSTIITTNLELSDWYELFQQKSLVDALLAAASLHHDSHRRPIVTQPGACATCPTRIRQFPWSNRRRQAAKGIATHDAKAEASYRDEIMSPPSTRSLPFAIPAYWTPEQALAVVELLEDLRDLIWSAIAFCSNHCRCRRRSLLGSIKR
jgi:hypothetical protein